MLPLVHVGVAVSTIDIWPKLLGAFQNSFTTFYVYMSGMLFYITSATKNQILIFLIVFLTNLMP